MWNTRQGADYQNWSRQNLAQIQYSRERGKVWVLCWKHWTNGLQGFQQSSCVDVKSTPKVVAIKRDILHARQSCDALHQVRVGGHVVLKVQRFTPIHGLSKLEKNRSRSPQLWHLIPSYCCSQLHKTGQGHFKFGNSFHSVAIANWTKKVKVISRSSLSILFISPWILTSHQLHQVISGQVWFTEQQECWWYQTNSHSPERNPKHYTYAVMGLA